jgi:methyl-accepting chemotaxis protein
MAMLDELRSISQETATEADTVAGAAEDQSRSISEVSDSARQLRDRADDLEQLLDRFTIDGSSSMTTTSTDSAITDD